MKHSFSVVLLCTASFASATLRAQSAHQPGETFIRTFSATCVVHMPDLEGLRTRFLGSGYPRLAASQQFLGGRAGDAWSVPEGGSTGNLVLALPEGGRSCLVLGRRGPAAAAEAEFVDLASHPPARFRSARQPDRSATTPTGAETHTLGYIWTVDGVPGGIAFVLTTSTSEDAPMQLMASETLVRD